jgi:hypothetical protein
MSAGVGQMVPEEYIPLLVEETRLGEEDTRAVRWQRDPTKLGIDAFRVVVIGAKFAGMMGKYPILCPPAVALPTPFFPPSTPPMPIDR